MGSRTLLLAIVLLVSLQPLGTGAAEPTIDSYLLINASSSGYITIRDLVFTNRDTDVEIRIRDVEGLGRTSARFFLEPVPAGYYYLSGLYTSIRGMDSGPRIDIDETDDYIMIVGKAINYVGDLTVNSEEGAGGVVRITGISYEANGATLMAAAASEKALFESHDITVTIAGNQPVTVDKSLLGL